MQVITNPNKTIPNINEDTESEFIVRVDTYNNVPICFHVMTKYSGSSYLVWKGGDFGNSLVDGIQMWAPLEKSKIKVLLSTYEFNLHYNERNLDFYIMNTMEEFLNLAKKIIPCNNEVVYKISHNLRKSITLENKFIIANIKNSKQNSLYFMVADGHCYKWKGGSIHGDISELDITQFSPGALMDCTNIKFNDKYNVNFYSIDDIKYLSFFAKLMGM